MGGVGAVSHGPQAVQGGDDPAGEAAVRGAAGRAFAELESQDLRAPLRRLPEHTVAGSGFERRPVDAAQDLQARPRGRGGKAPDLRFQAKGLDRTLSVSSMRRRYLPPWCRANSQLKSAVRAPPMCR